MTGKYLVFGTAHRPEKEKCVLGKGRAERSQKSGDFRSLRTAPQSCSLQMCSDLWGVELPGLLVSQQQRTWGAQHSREVVLSTAGLRSQVHSQRPTTGMRGLGAHLCKVHKVPTLLHTSLPCLHLGPGAGENSPRVPGSVLVANVPQRGKLCSLP